MPICRGQAPLCIAAKRIEDARILEEELALLRDENLEGCDVEGFQIDVGVGEVGVSGEIQHEVRSETGINIAPAREWESWVLSGLLVVTR